MPYYSEQWLTKKPSFSFFNWLLNFSAINSVAMAVVCFFLPSWSGSWLENFYLAIALFGHMAGLNLLLCLIVYLICFFIPSVLWKMGFCVVLWTLAQLTIITNLFIYSIYHFHINGMVLNLMTGGALLENIAFSWAMWRNIVLLVLAVIVIELFIVKISRLFHASKKIITIIIINVVFIQLLNGFADALGWQKILQKNRYIPWMYATTMRSSLKRLGFSVAEKPRDLFKQESSALKYPLQPLECETNKTNLPNIVFLVVDSLRSDMLNEEVMPFAYALKKDALEFNNHYSTSNSTRYGIFTLFYGLSGHYWRSILLEERASLLMQTTVKNNYQHFIYGSSKLTFPEFDRTIFSDLRNQLQKGHYKNSAANDKNITERFIKNLETVSSPFFGFLFYDAPHAYSLPDNYQSPFQPRLNHVDYLALNKNYDPIPFINLYKSTAHYVDGLIHQVIEELKRKKIFDNSIIIITSDHGQEFNETGKNYWGHNSNFSVWQTKVPLLILWPRKTHQVFSSLSSHEDVVPTLLQDVFNCSTPIKDYSTGQHLFNLNSDNRSILMENWTDRVIYYKENLYIIDHLGDIDAVDKNYDPIENAELPPQILNENLEKMSRFLKH
jgi:uncharacterized protein